jgi:hypothetical protein
VFYSAVSQLYRDEKVVLEGDRANFYVPHKDDRLPDLDDDLTIHHPDNLDDSIFEEEEPPEPTGGDDGTGDDTTDDDDGPDKPTHEGGGTGRRGGGGGGSTFVTTTRETINLEGNSARVLRSMAESRVNSDTDTTVSVDLNYDVEGLSKDELIEFLEQLPSGDHIDATVVVERETEN